MSHLCIAERRCRYLAAHKNALVVLATDDRGYSEALKERYGERLVAAGEGYETRNVVRDPSLPAAQKGRDHSIAEHSRAGQSRAEQSTAQHSTAQHNGKSHYAALCYDLLC